MGEGFLSRLLARDEPLFNKDRRGFLATSGALIAEGTLATIIPTLPVDAQTSTEKFATNLDALQNAISDPKTVATFEKGRREEVVEALRSLPENGYVLNLPPAERTKLLGRFVPPGKDNGNDVSKWPAVGMSAQTKESASKGDSAPKEHRYMNGIPAISNGKNKVIVPSNRLSGTVRGNIEDLGQFQNEGHDLVVHDRPAQADGLLGGPFKNAPAIRKAAISETKPARTVISIIGYSLTADRKWNSAAQAGTAWDLSKHKSLRVFIETELVKDMTRGGKMSAEDAAKMAKDVLPKYLDNCYAVKVGNLGAPSPGGNYVGEVNVGGLAIMPSNDHMPFGIKSMQFLADGFPFALIYKPEILRKMPID